MKGSGFTGKGDDPDKWTYYIDGKEVTRKAYKRAFPDKPLGDNGNFITLWNKPIESNAMAVHPTQIAETVERNRKAGINVDYTPTGEPILRSSRDRQNLMRLEGLHDRDGAYTAGGTSRTEKPEKRRTIFDG